MYVDDVSISVLVLDPKTVEIKQLLQQSINDCLTKTFSKYKIYVHFTPAAAINRSNTPSLVDKDNPLQIKKYICVASCKGGVGKSTISRLLALSLVGQGLQVGLLDVDIFGPSIPTMFDLQGVTPQLSPQEKMIPLLKDGIKLASLGFLTGENPMVMRGPMVSSYVQQLFHKVEWGDLDCLVIDLPPGTGDIQLTVTQTVSIDAAVIVTTPHQLSLVDVGRGILMFEKVQVPVLGVIENMSYFVCPQDGTQHAIFGSGAAQKISRRYGISVLGTLPIDSIYGDFSSEIPQAFPPIGRRIWELLSDPQFARKDIPQVESREGNFFLTWLSGKHIFISNKKLRYYCNSALNANEFTGERKIRWNEIPTGIQPVTFHTLGNYALQVEWSDGHQSIFPFSYIQEILLLPDCPQESDLATLE